MNLKIKIAIITVFLTLSITTVASASLLNEFPQKITDAFRYVFTKNATQSEQKVPVSQVPEPVTSVKSDNLEKDNKVKGDSLDGVTEESPQAIAKYQAERLARGTDPNVQSPFTFSIQSPKDNSTVNKQDMLVSWTYKNNTKYSQEFFIYLSDLSSPNKKVVYSTDITNRSSTVIFQDSFIEGHTYELRISANIKYTGDGRSPYELVDRIVKFKVVQQTTSTVTNQVQSDYYPLILSPTTGSVVTKNDITVRWLGMKSPISYTLYFTRLTEPIYTNKCVYTDNGSGALQSYISDGHTFNNVRILSFKIPFPMDPGEYEAYIVPLVPNNNVGKGPSIKINVQAQ